MRVEKFVLLIFLMIPACAIRQQSIARLQQADETSVHVSQELSNIKVERTEESPSGDIVVEHCSDDGKQQIWLVSKNNKLQRALLYEHNRYAEVLFSPDEQWLVVNDDYFSNESEVILFERKEGLTYKEMRKSSVREKTWKLCLSQQGLNKSDFTHTYVKGIYWASNSNALLLELKGHGDKQYLDSWLCVYDLERLEPSLNLSLMNRHVLHSK